MTDILNSEFRLVALRQICVIPVQLSLREQTAHPLDALALNRCNPVADSPVYCLLPSFSGQAAPWTSLRLRRLGCIHQPWSFIVRSNINEINAEFGHYLRVAREKVRRNIVRLISTIEAIGRSSASSCLQGSACPIS